MNSAQWEAWERYEEGRYLDLIDAQEREEARMEQVIADGTEYLLQSYLRDAHTPSDKFRTYTAEQQLCEVLCSDEETTWEALLEVIRRAAIGQNVQKDAYELLRKLAHAWVSMNRETYIKD